MKLCWHKYTIWSDPVETYSGHMQQWRKCEHCNKADFRTLWWHNQTRLAAVLTALQSVVTKSKS